MFYPLGVQDFFCRNKNKQGFFMGCTLLGNTQTWVRLSYFLFSTMHGNGNGNGKSPFNHPSENVFQASNNEIRVFERRYMFFIKAFFIVISAHLRKDM